MNKELMFNWLNKAYAVDLVFHIDADGLTAAAQVIKHLKKLGKKGSLFTGSAQKLSKPYFYKKLKNELVIFIDLAADAQYEEVYKLTNRANVIIIDHHKLTKDLNNKSIVQFSPELMGVKKYYPASKMVYDLFNGIDWMACIGVIGDYGGRHWKEFINKTLKKYGLKPCADENCFDTEFAYYDQLINAAGMVKGEEGSLKALEILSESSSYEEFKEKCEVLRKWHEAVTGYLNELEDDFYKEKEEHKDLDLIFYEIDKPKYRVGGALSTRLTTKIPNKTLVLMLKKNSVINISLRRQDGLVDVAELAVKSIKGFEKATGGGHAKAAGALIKASDLTEFKEAFKKALKSSG